MQLSVFLEEITSASFLEELVSTVEAPSEVVVKLVNAFANEARLGYALVYSHLSHSTAILEVGAGIGVLSAFLSINGYKIVAIEPSGTGFELNHKIGRHVYSKFGLNPNMFVDRGVESLDRSVFGEFDLIFSINVLEHVENVGAAFKGMANVLASDGLMLHTCPNYHVPYEPHFGVFLIPLLPGLTGYLLPEEISDSKLWESLNFITSSDVKRECRRVGLGVTFDRFAMESSVQRVKQDRVFGARHQGLVGFVSKLLIESGLVRMLRFWPVALSTPMAFTCKKINFDSEARFN